MKEERKEKLGPGPQSQPHGPELLSPLEQAINRRKPEGKKQEVSQARTLQENMPKKKGRETNAPQVPSKAQKSLSYRNQALHSELRLALRRIQMRIRNEPKAMSDLISSPGRPRCPHPEAAPHATPRPPSVAGPACSSEGGSLRGIVRAICVPPLSGRGTAKSSRLGGEHLHSSGVPLPQATDADAGE